MTALLNPPKGVELKVCRSREEWLAHRRRCGDITASVASVLFSTSVQGFGLKSMPGVEHPYKKLQDVMSALVEPSRVKRVDSSYHRAGRVFEPAVAEYVAMERPEWELRRLHGPGEHLYLRDPKVRLGATPDPWVVFIDGALWLLEIKTASWKEYGAKQWDRGVPGFISIQAQVQAHLAGAVGTVVACMQRSDFGLGKLAIHLVRYSRVVGCEVARRAAVIGRYVRQVRRRNRSIAAARKGGE